MLKHHRFPLLKSIPKKRFALQRLLHWWRSLRYHRYYVIADCSDNSITFSRKLYRHIELSSHCEDAAKAFVFHIPAWGTYGFTVNPVLDRETVSDPSFHGETQLADIQYNEKYKTIGFESLCPSVNRIFCDYGLPYDLKMKLTVTVHQLGDGRVFYNIEPPRP